MYGNCRGEAEIPMMKDFVGINVQKLPILYQHRVILE